MVLRDGLLLFGGGDLDCVIELDGIVFCGLRSGRGNGKGFIICIGWK